MAAALRLQLEARAGGRGFEARVLSQGWRPGLEARTFGKSLEAGGRGARAGGQSFWKELGGHDWRPEMEVGA